MFSCTSCAVAPAGGPTQSRGLARAAHGAGGRNGLTIVGSIGGRAASGDGSGGSRRGADRCAGEEPSVPSASVRWPSSISPSPSPACGPSPCCPSSSSSDSSSSQARQFAQCEPPENPACTAEASRACACCTIRPSDGEVTAPTGSSCRSRSGSRVFSLWARVRGRQCNLQTIARRHACAPGAVRGTGYGPRNCPAAVWDIWAHHSGERGGRVRRPLTRSAT